MVNTTIHHLDLSGTTLQTNVGSEGARPLADTLRIPNPLRQLRAGMSGRNMWTGAGGDDSDDHFALHRLDLSFNDIDDAVGVRLAAELMSNCTVRHLILRHNRLGEEAADHFAKMLRINKHMRKLNLAHNWLNPKAGVLLAEMLTLNKGLRDFDLSCNRIGSLYITKEEQKRIPAQAWGKHIREARYLETLDLGGCGFDDDDRALIHATMTSTEDDDAVVKKKTSAVLVETSRTFATVNLD